MSDEELKYTDADLETAKETIESTLKERLEKEYNEKVAEHERLLEEKEAEFDKLKNKDMNFEQLRKSTVAKDEIKGQIDEMKAKFEEDMSKLVQAREQETIEEFAEENIKDADDKKVWEFYFKKTSVGAKTKKEIKEAMQDALVLVQAKKGDKDLGIIPTRASVGTAPKKVVLDEATMEKVGLTKETHEKYKEFKPIKYN